MKRIISFLCVLFITLFLSINDCLASEVKIESNNNFSQESKSDNVSDNNNKTDIPKASNEDIFGDEQSFPFIAGLGKNAAH